MASPPEDTIKPEPDGGPTPPDPAAPDGGEHSAPDGPSPSAADRIKPVVAEIRERLADLATRDSFPRQRVQDLEPQPAPPPEAGPGDAPTRWAQAQQRLAQGSAELDAQAVELTARRGRLDEIEQRLIRRQAKQERTQKDIAEAVQRLRRRSGTQSEHRQQDRQTLQERVKVIRVREKDLEQRIVRAHGDILQQRKELDQRRGALDQRAAAFEIQERELQTRHASLERDVSHFQARANEVKRRESELAAAKTQVRNREAELQQASRELERERKQLVDKQRELDQRWRAARDQRHELTRQAEDVDARRRLLQQQQAASEQRQRRLGGYDQQLRARAETLETEARQLAHAENESAERRGAAEARVCQADEVLRDTERQREESLALREQAEARDAQSRQMQLALELEQQEQEQQRAALEVAQEELAGQRTRRQAEFVRVRDALQERTDQLRQAERSVLAGPRRRWLRSSLLAVVAGLLAGLAWWTYDQPRFRAASELRITGPAIVAQQALSQHERRLRTPGVLAQLLEDDTLRRGWEDAWAGGDVRIAAQADPPALRVSVDGPDRAAVRTLVEQVGAGYRRLAQRLPVGAPDPTQLQRLSQERETLAEQRQLQQKERGALQVRLESLATREDRQRVRTELVQQRSEYDEAGRALVRERGRLATLMSGPTPRGTVSPVDFEKARATDEMYGEDSKECRASAVQYRSELVVAMLMIVDPAATLRRVLGGFADTLTEQRELKPPTPVAAVLEQATSEVAAFAERLSSFTQQWQQSLEAVQAMEPTRQLPELVARQRAVDDQVQKLCGEADALVDGIRAALDKLGEESDGGTRAVVVAAVLRGELTDLAQAAAGLRRAAQHTDLMQNFRLDALDRQLRGLRTRLDRRQAAIRRDLQFEADQQTRLEHAQAVEKLRLSAQVLEKRRDELISELSVKLEELRGLDEAVAERLVAQAGLDRCQAALADLEQKIGEIDEQLAAAESGGSGAPPLEVGPVDVTTIAGAQRDRNALLSGLGGLAATYALCLLMAIRNPWRRRPAWEESLAELSPTAARTGSAAHSAENSAPNQGASS